MFEYIPYIMSQIVQPFNLVLLFAATVIGLVFGAIPGLSGTLAVMLFMPLTYSMQAGPAVIFLIALWVGGCSGSGAVSRGFLSYGFLSLLSLFHGLLSLSQGFLS